MDKCQSHFSGCSEFVNFIFRYGGNNFSSQFFYHKYTSVYAVTSYLVVITLYFSLIVSVIFIFGDSGTRICLAFNTFLK